LEDIVPFCCIATSISWGFLKIETSQSPRTRYKRCMIGRDRSIIKDTSLGEQRAYSALSGFPLEGFSREFISRICHKRSKSGCDREMIKGILLWGQTVPLECISAFVGRILVNIHTAHIPRMLYKECNFDCDRSKFRALLEECALLGFILVSFWGVFLKIRVTYSIHACDTNGGSLVANGQ